MIGPGLRRLADSFVEMPTDEFLARLVKSRVPGASVVIVGDSDEKGAEAVSKGVPSVSEALDHCNMESNAGLVRDKEKKRYRDGNSSRGHHSKKLKEPMVCLNVEEVVPGSKSGSESCARVTADLGFRGGSIEGGLLICKNYVEKVFVFCPFIVCCSFILYEVVLIVVFCLCIRSCLLSWENCWSLVSFLMLKR